MYGRSALLKRHLLEVHNITSAQDISVGLTDLEAERKRIMIKIKSEPVDPEEMMDVQTKNGSHNTSNKTHGEQEGIDRTSADMIDPSQGKSNQLKRHQRTQSESIRSLTPGQPPGEENFSVPEPSHQQNIIRQDSQSDFEHVQSEASIVQRPPEKPTPKKKIAKRPKFPFNQIKKTKLRHQLSYRRGSVSSNNNNVPRQENNNEPNTNIRKQFLPTFVS